jgi:tetratricopeptide (TPR) repeat protein
MHNNRTTLAAFLLACAVSWPAAAQDWVGMGRARGEVKDEQGKPVAGANVFLRRDVERIDPANPGPGPKAAVTDKRGRWAVAGIAGGVWTALITKEGFVPASGAIRVQELEPGPAVETVLQQIPKEYIEAQEQAAAMKTAAAAVDRGNALLVESKPAEARIAYEEALANIADVKHHPGIMLGIARTYHMEGKVDDAAATLKKALDVVPDDDDTETLRLLADILLAAGREAEAKPYMARLPEGTRVDPISLLNIGISRYNEGKMDEALAQFEGVVADNPDLGVAYYYRGLAHLGLGNNDRAKADFQKFLELAPDHAKAAEAAEFLKSL